MVALSFTILYDTFVKQPQSQRSLLNRIKYNIKNVTATNKTSALLTLLK